MAKLYLATLRRPIQTPTRPTIRDKVRHILRKPRDEEAPENKSQLYVTIGSRADAILRSGYVRIGRIDNARLRRAWRKFAANAVATRISSRLSRFDLFIVHWRNGHLG